MLGQAGDDQLFGGLGRDLLQDGAGNDRVNGEKDTDTVMGGSGRGADRDDRFADPRAETYTPRGSQ
ncbi:MAG: hypothetical protein IAG10_12000 [Planctomycetaceae bacterium]|nr:hypothetical protein [Planctomycetaceae bacterium]